MLKESGKVFDSNMNGTACSCRLGDEEFIDGWNIGIDGMRIGDKRRLIIPPSMGLLYLPCSFGSNGVGENVPPNSWLLYDIELVNVR
ncbi:peptidyl-prolyl cis-trans isomerase FKBP53-like [Primulina huaijiensis]|uniref:peptidyl-prolyl cis-trans isomerase FKBP53-like n=1 Tax=Primulina huaijiensis TaxID=1492673 RepID=UPI003CC72E67